MKNSDIEWCDHTFNPWEGCTKVSPGCVNCYAETRNARFGGGTAVNWGKGAPRRRTSAANWAQPIKWNAEAGRIMRELHNVSRSEFDQVDYERPRVFCASLADWLDDEVPIDWLADLLALVQATPNLDWLLLTKRIENWRLRIDAACHDIDHADNGEKYLLNPGAWLASWLAGNAPANVWIGTTVEDQTRANERIPALLSIPARVRFLSCEPLLGPVDLEAARKAWTGLPGIDWVITGGESGPKARPMHPDWARSLRDQCADAGVPFLFKQWGEWAPAVAHLKPFDRANPTAYVNHCTWVSNWKVAGVLETTKRQNLTTPERPPHSFADGEILAFKVGKSEAGRQLDGIEHNGFPGGGA